MHEGLLSGSLRPLSSSPCPGSADVRRARVQGAAKRRRSPCPCSCAARRQTPGHRGRRISADARRQPGVQQHTRPRPTCRRTGRAQLPGAALVPTCRWAMSEARRRRPVPAPGLGGPPSGGGCASALPLGAISNRTLFADAKPSTRQGLGPPAAGNAGDAWWRGRQAPQEPPPLGVDPPRAAPGPDGQRNTAGSQPFPASSSCALVTASPFLSLPKASASPTIPASLTASTISDFGTAPR